MAISNYSELVQAIKDFSHRSDISTYIPMFISLAEQRIGRELKVRELEATATGTLSGSSLALPIDFSMLRQFKIQTTNGYFSPVNIGADSLADRSLTEPGLPNYFSIGSVIQFSRPTDAAYNYTLEYFKKPLSVEANDITDLLTAYPEVYLFASLIEVGDFTKNDRDIQRYTQKYAELVKSANGVKTGGQMRMINA